MKTYQTPQFPLRFEKKQFEPLPYEVLQRMSARWSGWGSTKVLFIESIMSGLESEIAIQQVLNGLDAASRCALAIIKEHGGVINAGMLEDILEAYGYSVIQEPEYRHQYGMATAEFASKLYRAGMLMVVTGYPPYGVRDKINAHIAVYTDERILRQVDWPVAVQPLTLTPAPAAPPTPNFRRPQHVTLDLMAITRALDAIKQLQVTKTRTIRVTDLRRFRKLMGWEDEVEFDGHKFPAIATAVLFAWMQVGWLKGDADALTLSMPPDAYAQIPLLQQVSMLAQAFLELSQWNEMEGMEEREAFYREEILQMRVLVFHGLRALPDYWRFYTLDEFLPAIYQRIGDIIQTAPDYQNPRPWQSGRNKEQYQPILTSWREKNRAHWVTHERGLIEEILTGWPYWLGLLEIGVLEQGNFAFRLTELGRLLFTQDVAKPTAELPAPASEQPAWVVQPNYDLIVYLDASTSEQLAFLERYAERRQTEAYTIHYQLTRDSIYRGLESGAAGIEEILSTLRQGARTELPQNVERELREWAGQREQLTLFTRGRLLAFPTQEERALALDAGLPGTPVAELYVHVPADAQIKAALKVVYGLQPIPSIDYTAPLPRCLRAAEDGTLTLTAISEDLLLTGQLAHCAEQQGARRWRLTPASLSAPRQAGVTATILLQMLQARAGDLPALLALAIRNALGVRESVQAGDAYVLRIPDKQLYAAIAGSPLLKPFLLDVPGPDTLIVDPARLQEFKAQLAWLGVKLTPYTVNEKRPDWLKTIRDAKTQQRRRGY